MQQIFKQLIDRYESENGNGFAQNYRDRSVDELEEIIIDFQIDYRYGDSDSQHCESISIADRLVFSSSEPCTQAEFLGYLAAKIAVARN